MRLRNRRHRVVTAPIVILVLVKALAQAWSAQTLAPQVQVNYVDYEKVVGTFHHGH